MASGWHAQTTRQCYLRTSELSLTSEATHIKPIVIDIVCNSSQIICHALRQSGLLSRVMRPLMKERCMQCKGKFGLIRYSGFYLSEQLVITERQFCSERCKLSYDQERIEGYQHWYKKMRLNSSKTN